MATGYFCFSKSGYFFRFNGKENDSETSGDGNECDYGFRIYNPRLVKFWSVDPLTNKYAELTPYQFAGNTPISCIDVDGLESYYTADGRLIGKIGTSTEIRIVKDADIKTVAAYVNWANKSSTPKYIAYATNQANKFSQATTISLSKEIVLPPSPSTEKNGSVKKTEVSGKPWYDLEGSDNGGNDRVAPGGPDAAGVTIGGDLVLGGGGGASISTIETPTGDAVFETTKLASVGLSIGFGTGVTAGWYTGGKTDPKQQTEAIEGTGYVINIFILSISGDISKNPDGSASFSKNWFNIGLSANLGFDIGVTDTRKIENK